LVNTINPFSPDNYGSSRQGKRNMGGENTGSLSYKGHGRIERYPRNLNIAYVTGHERGHANSNKLEALAKNETVEQNISYKLTLTKQGMVAEGVTKRTRNIPASDGSLQKMEAYSSALSDSAKGSGLNLSGILLKNELSRLKNEQLNPSSSQSHQTSSSEKQNNAAISGHQQAHETFIGINGPGLKGKSNQGDLFVRIKELEAKLTEGETRKAISSDSNRGKPALKKADGGPKEEHIDLTRGAELSLQSHMSSVTGVPPLEAVSGGSTFSYQSVMNDIQRYNNFTVLDNQQQIDPNRLRAKSSFWSSLETKLTNLQTATQQLSNFSSYVNNQTSSYSSSFVDFSTSVQTSPATYAVDVSQIAEFQKVQSDIYANTGTGLGLTGTFSLNGSSISVIASDSINSIMDKINWGEDLNKNNVLEYSEDVNGNGTLENYVSGGHLGPYVYINEDSNFNNINDGSEDVNNNDRLDGGTRDHGVLATIQNSRLTLTSQGSTNLSEVYFSGGGASNSLLASLGIMEQNLVDTGNQSSLFRYSTKNETASQDAFFSVNGTNYVSDSNQISGLAPNATMNIKKVTDVTQTINIKANADIAANFIKEFIRTYNDAMRHMNDSLMRGEKNSGLMRGDLDLVRVRKEVIDSVQGGNFPDNKIIRMMESIGITPSKGSERGISILAAQNLANNLAKNAANGNGAPHFSVGNSVAKVASVGNYSNLEGLTTAKVGSTEDFTLYYDSSKLNQAIKGSPQHVFNIFNDSNVGSIPLLSGRLNAILDPQSGTIANKQRLAQVHIQRDRITDSTQDNQHAFETSQQLKSFARNYLSQYQSYSLNTTLGALSVTA